MVSELQVLDALSAVMDPELGRSLVELGMIHEVEIDGETVRFQLALTTLACPLKEQIVGAARAAVSGLDGVQNVELDIRGMTDEEKRRCLSQPRKPEPGASEQLNHIKRVIAVMSGKGGVGKSSVTALLAVALRRQGNRVGILDADITGPSIPKMFGLNGQPISSAAGILPVETVTGIRVMSINLLLPEEDDAVIWRGPLVSGAIRQFWGDVFWGDLDVLLVDLPPGTSDASLTVMQAIPINGIVLVTSPQDLAGMVVRKAAHMAEKMKVEVVGLIENMSYAKCPHCGERLEVFGPSQADRTAELLGVPMLGQLPLDPEMALRSDAGEIEEYSAEKFEPISRVIWAKLAGEPSEPMS
jgi:Mrp family chromosome partitioning ATPase